MVPYVVKDGEHLDLIAHRLRLDAQTIWNDPQNADLRKARPNPNVLASGDILYVPSATPAPQWLPLATGQSNAFKAQVPETPVSVQIKDRGKPLANAPYTIQELPQLTGLSTDGQGFIKLSVPVVHQILTAVFTKTGRVQVLHIGHLDPETTPSGVAQRLKNLGHLTTHGPPRSASGDAVANAISLFQQQQKIPVTGKPDAATIAALSKLHGA